MASLTKFTSVANVQRVSLAQVSLAQIPGLVLNPPLRIPLPEPPTPIIPLTPLGNDAVVPGSARTRPLWFNGRFLAAQDLRRDQTYFLQGQSALGQAGGFGVIHGLEVSQAMNGNEPDPETIVIGAGQGTTPGGELVLLSANLTVRLSDLAVEADLDLQFGLSETPEPLMRTRTGLYVIALRAVEFTANPITSYPSSIQGSRTTHDGSIIEATAVSLVPYPIPATDTDAVSQNAAAAWQVFAQNNSGTLSDSLLPVAMISIERGTILWIDQWLVRRESGPEFNGLRFGLTEIAAEQAYLRQYDAQLEKLVQPILDAKNLPDFPATTYFQALPPAGRIPFAAIDTTGFTQVYFPPQTQVTLSLVPQDELAAILDDSMTLPPIDLTLPPNAYADLAVMVLVPVTRSDYAGLAAGLPPVGLKSRAPLAIRVGSPLDLLRFFHGLVVPPIASPGVSWKSAIGDRVYGYYVRQRSVPAFVSFQVADTTTTLALAAVTGSKATRYTATVTPSAATGTAVFKDGANNIGTAEVKSGAATLVLPTLSAGSHSLTAVYLGDVNYASSTSAAVVQNVPAS